VTKNLDTKPENRHRCTLRNAECMHLIKAVLLPTKKWVVLKQPVLLSHDNGHSTTTYYYYYTTTTTTTTTYFQFLLKSALLLTYSRSSKSKHL